MTAPEQRTEVALKLDAVADLLEHGWCQGSDHRVIAGRTCRCLDYAILQVTEGTRLYGLAHRFVVRVIGTHLIMTWNDRPGRTQAEVVAAARKAAALARSGES